MTPDPHRSTGAQDRSGRLQLGGDDLADEHFGLQRLAWAAMALLVAAAAAGLFGRGPLAKAQASAPAGNLDVAYERIARSDAPTWLRFTLRPSASCGSTAHLTLPADYVAAMQVERVVPPPVRTRAARGYVTYSFDVEPRSEARVVFDLKPQAIGLQQASVSLTGGPPVQIRQFVLP